MQTAIVAGLLSLCLLSLCGYASTGIASAASLDPFSDQVLSSRILGHVEDAAGIAQMGATVYLYNRYDQLVRHALTNEQGRFGFEALSPDIYSLRVILASFAPAERRNISLLPNSESRLSINLASVLSTVTIAPPRRSIGTLVTDDWKWVLRSSSATRPIMRFLPAPVTASTSRTLGSAFSDTTGVVKISAGDGQSFLQSGGEDLGTAFALATSLAGSARVQLSGNVGYAGSNLATPGAGFRTSYARDSADGSTPEVILTFHQFYTAPRAATAAVTGDSAPPLRTASLAVIDSIEVAENIRLDYGFNYNSVTYLDHLNYLSPFIRGTFDFGSEGRVRVAYSSGAPPAELLARDSAVSTSPDHARSSELDQDLTALSLVPRISLSNDHAVVQRTQDFEIGYERVEGTRTFTAGAYRESVSNAAFMLAGSNSSLPAGNLMPDLNSNSSILNVGSYQRTGVDAAVRQSIGDRFDIALAAGTTGALTLASAASLLQNATLQNATLQNATLQNATLPNTTPDLRDSLSQKQVAWVTIRISTTTPVTGTRITADYGWTDPGTLVPSHIFMTQRVNQDTGVNFYLRQPLPNILPLRIELTAELRNLLAQSYLPMGEHSVLTATPRAVRGGLNFIF